MMLRKQTLIEHATFKKSSLQDLFEKKKKEGVSSHHYKQFCFFWNQTLCIWFTLLFVYRISFSVTLTNTSFTYNFQLARFLLPGLLYC